MTSTSVECAQVLTVRSVPSRTASPTSPPFSRNHRSDPLQTLADLSDYLAPSQACIKPVTYVPDEQAEVNELDKPAAAAAVRCGVLSYESPLSSTQPVPLTIRPSQAEIIIGEDSSFYERGVDGERGKKLKKAEITLNDCLACS